MMSKQLRSAALAAAAILGTAGSAAAEGYIEGVVGAVFPLEEDGYADAVTEGLKVGIRGGSGLGPAAFELTADYTAFGTLEIGASELEFTRFRVLAGGRHRFVLDDAGKVALFVRAGVGVDVITIKETIALLGVEHSDSNTGVAGELGTGILVSLGKAYVGGHLALPIAYQRNASDSGDRYYALDLDVLFTVGARI